MDFASAALCWAGPLLPPRHLGCFLWPPLPAFTLGGTWGTLFQAGVQRGSHQCSPAACGVRLGGSTDPPEPGRSPKPRAENDDNSLSPTTLDCGMPICVKSQLSLSRGPGHQTGGGSRDISSSILEKSTQSSCQPSMVAGAHLWIWA